MKFILKRLVVILEFALYFTMRLQCVYGMYEKIKLSVREWQIRFVRNTIIRRFFLLIHATSRLFAKLDISGR